ncbi:IS1634 family transposase [Pontiella sulfatireligans]|uniref:IS1634 family transposase n=1 Tax=Pontiella sulfatireligans TaxID=2750658 RepID=UPI001C9E9F62|nr:IS1634 family transposase [Pontiella sulfatireligans]
MANLSGLPDELVEALRAALKGESIPASEGIASLEKAISIHDARQHGHVAAIHSVLKKSGLLGMIDSKRSRERDVVAAMIIDRIISGDSKLATVRHCDPQTASTSLGELLSLEDLHENECYAAMDWLLERQDKIQKKLAKKHLADGAPVLFDLSSSYFEGQCCELAQFGYSRDHRVYRKQVNYGIYCNSAGTPVGVEVLAGNESDRIAFPIAVERVRKDFNHKNVIFIGDRGMISGKAIDEYLRDEEGADWITALNAASIAKLERCGSIQLTFFDECDLASITHPDYPDERLVVCRNPDLAKRRSKRREALLQATEKLLAEIIKKVERKNKPLRGKDAIGVEVGKIINKKKMAKHFNLTIEDDTFAFDRNEEKIRSESATDGLYVIRSSVDKTRMTDQELVANYKNLEMVERAFRSLKSIDLNVRPIYHRLDNRVRAHIFICMLAYHIEHQMRSQLAPLLFADEQKETAAERDSVVDPVKRSDSAKKKDQTRRTPDGQHPISSFRDILNTLSAITRSRVKVEGHKKGDFKTTSTPTPYQQKILEWLGATRGM